MKKQAVMIALFLAWVIFLMSVLFPVAIWLFVTVAWALGLLTA